MSRIVPIAIFAIVFITIYFGLHLYAVFRIGGFFGIKRSFWLYIIAACLALAFIGTSMLERYFNGPVTKLVYSISASWIGLIFMLVSLLLVYEILSIFITFQPKVMGIILLSLVSLLTLYGIVNAQFIAVKEIQVPVQNLEKELSIVQLSDIHLGTVHKAAYMQKIVGMTNSLEPDMVLITGDLLDVSGKLPRTSIAPLNGLKAKAFFSIGNHEKYAGIDEVMKMMAETKVKVLRNEVVDYKGIQVIGVDNPEKDFQKANPVLGTIKIDKSKPSVLMYHVPFGLDDAVSAGITLQLSGHTHSGQVTPFDLIDSFIYKFIYGLHNYKGMYVYVTSGTGTWGPPMRVGSRSEIVLIRLVKA